jgi:hypothetical protein
MSFPALWNTMFQGAARKGKLLSLLLGEIFYFMLGDYWCLANISFKDFILFIE